MVENYTKRNEVSVIAKLFTTEFDISKEKMKELGVFDVLLDEDSSFFINLKRLKECEVPEFTGSYEKINDRFREIGLLLKQATPGSRLYRAAYERFNFPEVNGINLGFASGKHGAGFGKQLRAQIIQDAYEIIKSGSEQPEIFHLVGLFEDNVGPDRLSDMIARIIYSDIVTYTQRILTELEINPETYPKYQFKDGLVVNPYKRKYLLLLPECILHELPIARCWDDIDRVCAENDAIRAEINEEIGNTWRRMPTAERKEYLREQIFKRPDKLQRIISAYQSVPALPFNIFRNPEYITNYLIDTYEMPNSESKDSYSAALEIIENFKEWVEYHRGASVINGCGDKPSEKLVQRMIYAVGQMFCNKFNWCFSPETDSGRGPADFVVSRGIDKTVVEVKLTSNQDCEHGLEVQIEEYAIAENTEKKIFIVVDTGSNSYRVEKVMKKREEMLSKGLSPATVVAVDAVPKDSASKYKSKK